MYPSPLLHELHQHDLAALRQVEQARLLRAARAEAHPISHQQPSHQMKRSWWLKSITALKQIGTPFTNRGAAQKDFPAPVRRKEEEKDDYGDHRTRMDCAA